MSLNGILSFRWKISTKICMFLCRIFQYCRFPILDTLRAFIVYVVNHFCDRIWSLQVESNLCRFFIGCLYWYLKRSNYKEGSIETSFTGYTPPHHCVCLKPILGYPTSYVVFFMFSSWDERWLLTFLILVELCRLVP